MNFCLTIILLLLSKTSYHINNKCILGPSFVMSASMCLSSLIVTINTTYWNYSVSLETLLIITLSVISFMIGNTIVNQSKTNYCFNKNINVNNVFFKKTNIIHVFLLLAFSVVVFIYVFYTQHSRGAAIGMGQDLSSVIQANRYYLQNESNILMKLLLSAVKVLCEITIIRYFVFKNMYKKKTSSLFLIIMLVVTLLNFMMTTNRTEIISISSFVLFSLLYSKYIHYKWSKEALNIKIILKIILILFVALLIFRLLGYLTGKSDLYTFYDNICIYIGSSIVCFDKVITGNNIAFPYGYVPQIFGGYTIFLNMLGFNVEIDNLVWPHQYWDNGASNLYTSFFIYYVNYNVLGLLIIECFLGMIYGYIWKKVYLNRFSWVGVTIYGSILFYYLAMTPIYERFFTHFFTVTTLLEIIFMYIYLNQCTVLISDK